MDYLQLSVSLGTSGKFIELNRSGALEKARALWSKYYRLRRRLERVRAELCNCNDAAWLFRFADKCRRQHIDFEEQLRSLAQALEGEREMLEKEVEETAKKLEEVDPSLLEACHTLAGARLLHNYEASFIAAQTLNDDVLKRRGIIAKHPQLNSLDLCRKFDVENLGVPERWKEEFRDVPSWATAYKNAVCRNRINKMISQNKRRLRLP